MNLDRPPVAATTSTRGSWLRWKAGERKTVYLCAILLGASAFVLLVYIQKIWAEFLSETPVRPAAFGDFFALWSYARITAAHPAAELYDSASLHASQVALGMSPDAHNPFPYPPTFILYLWPLGLLPSEQAYVVWIVGTLGLFVWAVAATCSRAPLCVLGAIVAPASIATIDSGQGGFLAAALMTTGLRLAGSRPILAGLLLGALTYRPQLGLLAPVALASAGFWTAFGVAGATALALAGLATAVLGWAVWPAWISMLPAYESVFDRDPVNLAIKPTVMANLQMMGVPLTIAQAVQALVVLLVAILVWRCFRRSSGRLATAAVLVGTFLATPHAFVYDLPMTVVALALYVEERIEAGAAFTPAEALILILAYGFPVLMLVDVGRRWPVSAAPLALFFGLILWREAHANRANRHPFTTAS